MAVGFFIKRTALQIHVGLHIKHMANKGRKSVLSHLYSKIINLTSPTNSNLLLYQWF